MIAVPVVQCKHLGPSSASSDAAWSPARANLGRVPASLVCGDWRADQADQLSTAAVRRGSHCSATHSTTTHHPQRDVGPWDVAKGSELVTSTCPSTPAKCCPDSDMERSSLSFFFFLFFHLTSCLSVPPQTLFPLRCQGPPHTPLAITASHRLLLIWRSQSGQKSF